MLECERELPIIKREPKKTERKRGRGNFVEALKKMLGFLRLKRSFIYKVNKLVFFRQKMPFLSLANFKLLKK